MVIVEKCIRGDTSDNIFSAYPGARKKGTKNKIGMIEAFEDPNRWLNWNNLCYNDGQTNGDEHTVREDYERIVF